ncbi:MAG: thermonuclease family protein [Planctomycetes bacterium]|nr:thermonuclease family protein [Planctomycetota bacterium]
MARMAILALTLLLAGCITQEVDNSGNPIKRGKSEELVLDSAGRLVARPTLLKAPHTIIVNSNTPTEREVRLLGVEGLPEKQAPRTFAMTQEWMARYLAAEEQLFIKPAIDSDLQRYTIYGIVYVQAYETGADGKPGRMIPGGYLCVNQAMLSEGLVRIRNINEIEDAGLRDRMVKAESRAKAEKVGLWSAKP